MTQLTIYDCSKLVITARVRDWAVMNWIGQSITATGLMSSYCSSWTSWNWPLRPVPGFHTLRVCVGETEKALSFSWLKFFLHLGRGDFGQELFCKTSHTLVILRTEGQNWDGTYFKMGLGTRCLECNEWTLTKFDSVNYGFIMLQFNIM